MDRREILRRDRLNLTEDYVARINEYYEGLEDHWNSESDRNTNKYYGWDEDTIPAVEFIGMTIFQLTCFVAVTLGIIYLVKWLF